MGGPFNFIPRSSSLSRSQLPRELHSSGVEQVKLEHVEHYEKPDSYPALPPSGPRPAAKSTHATFEPSKAFVRQLTTKSEYRCSPWATLRAAWCLCPTGARRRDLLAQQLNIQMGGSLTVTRISCGTACRGQEAISGLKGHTVCGRQASPGHAAEGARAGGGR